MMNKTKAEVAPAKVAQHTPGPWVVELEEGPDGIQDITVKFPGYDGTSNGRPKAIDPFRVATLNSVYFGCHDSEAKANARLIAAAPELLQALRVVYNNHSGEWRANSPDAVLARAAIAKAEGKL